MIKNNRLIYSITDDLGPVQVYENQVLRSLHFGTRARQSAMYPNKPYLLPLSYSRYMLAPLLFIPRVRRVLILGFGAGSLFQYMNYHFKPELDIVTVELRQAVIDVARDYFHLQEYEQDLEINVMPAMEYLEQEHAPFDLVFVDIYNDKGADQTLLEQRFFTQLLRHVNEHGMISVNLWSSHSAAFKQVSANIQQHFPYLLNLPVPNKGNVIVLAGQTPTDLMHPDLMSRAKLLQQQFNTEFPMLLNQLRNYNR
ncbi:MAG: hypothetical protein HUJ29_13885 [Gammaproteobacteria bacterium]|nr:hypothetical protein [Gammaproteobacteria bacterium]